MATSALIYVDRGNGTELPKAEDVLSAALPNVLLTPTGSSTPATIPDLFQTVNTRLNTVEGALSVFTATTYNTRALAAASSVPSSNTLKRALGYNTAGDGGGADYRRAVTGDSISPLYSFTTPDNVVWTPVGADRNVRQAGARGDGVTDDLVVFRDSPVGVRVKVPPGNYYLGSNIVDFTRQFEFVAPGVTFTGPGQLYADIKRPYLDDIYRASVGSVEQAMAAGTPVTIDCFGDSLTWSLIGDGSTTNTAESNGYVGLRSSVTYPQSFQAALRSVYQNNPAGGSNITVHNCGYPGDHSYEMLNRWRSRGASDVAVIMIGSNEGIDGKSIIYVHYLREFIEKRLELGCLVVLMLPPEAPMIDANARIQPFRSAMRDLANEYNLVCVDARDQLRPLGAKQWASTTDVHLTLAGYKLLGWDLAAIFAPTGERAVQKLGPGLRVTAGDMPVAGFGGHIHETSYIISRDGFLIQIDPNYTASLPVYVEDDCAAVLETVNTDSNTDRHLLYILGGQPTVTALFSNPPVDGVYRRGYGLPPLSRGWRLIQLQGAGGATAYFDAITCFSPETHIFTTAGLYRKSALSGTRRPSAFTGSGGWAQRDYVKVPWVHHLSAEVTLPAAGNSGVMIVADEISNLDILSNNELMIMRNGNSLVIRDQSSGVADTVVASIFPDSGDWTGTIDVEITHPDPTQAQVNVLVNGTAAASRGQTTIVGGYVGIFSGSTIKCLELSVLDG